MASREDDILGMENIKIGCDLVFIPRFKKILLRTPAVRRRIFLPQEEKNASVNTLAGIFAAKEAAVKAFGVPAGRWQEIEIYHEKNGEPRIRIKGRKCKVSIAHDGDYAMALVVSSR